MKTTTRISSLAAVAGLVLVATAPPVMAAQVAPNVVFINSGERGSELMVHNPGQAPLSVRVELLFGYEDAGEDGQVGAVYPDSEERHERSAAEWLRAYPQRVVVAPGQRQTIRLFVRAPAETPEGEYWARASIQTQPAAQPAEDLDGEDIQVRVGVTTRQRVPIFVRVGDPEVSVKLTDVSFDIEPEREGSVPVLRGLYHAEVDGPAAFLGGAALTIEKDGVRIVDASAPLAVFVSGRRQIRVPLPEGLTREELEGARIVLEAVREHPVVQTRHILAGSGHRWEGVLGGE